jgi:hypothetical protein
VRCWHTSTRRSSRWEDAGLTAEIGTTRRSFKREIGCAGGDQNNLDTRRGRLPSGSDHSQNLSGQRSRTRPGRPSSLNSLSNQIFTFRFENSGCRPAAPCANAERILRWAASGRSGCDNSMHQICGFGRADAALIVTENSPYAKRPGLQRKSAHGVPCRGERPRFRSSPSRPPEGPTEGPSAELGRAFSPSIHAAPETQGFALGCYETGLRPWSVPPDQTTS